MSAPLEPPTIPCYKGLLQPSSPVLCTGSKLNGSQAIVLEVPRGGVGNVRLYFKSGPLTGKTGWVDVADVALLLTRDTGRRHALQYLCRRLEHKDQFGNMWSVGGLRWGWVIDGVNKQRGFILPSSWDDKHHSKVEGCVRAVFLSGLDPRNPLLLADGSRWVDAEALRRTCVWAAALTVTP